MLLIVIIILLALQATITEGEKLTVKQCRLSSLCIMLSVYTTVLHQ